MLTLMGDDGATSFAAEQRGELPPPPWLFGCLGPLTFGPTRAGRKILLEHRNPFLILRMKEQDVPRCSLLYFLGHCCAKSV